MVHNSVSYCTEKLRGGDAIFENACVTLFSMVFIRLYFQNMRCMHINTNKTTLGPLEKENNIFPLVIFL